MNTLYVSTHSAKTSLQHTIYINTPYNTQYISTHLLNTISQQHPLSLALSRRQTRDSGPDREAVGRARDPEDRTRLHREEDGGAGAEDS